VHGVATGELGFAHDTRWVRKIGGRVNTEITEAGERTGNHIEQFSMPSPPSAISVLTR